MNLKNKQMKQISLIVFMTFLGFTINAQIKVYSNGDAEIGNALFTYLNNNSGISVNLKSRNWDGGIVLDNSGYWSNSTLRPYTDWYGNLGTENYRWGLAHVDHVFCAILDVYSDEKIKENIKKLDSPLEKILKLNGVKYDHKPSFYDLKTKNGDQSDTKNKLLNDRKNQIGFIAQELSVVFPELVNKLSDSSLYSVNYIGLIPVLVEALKEQQVQLNSILKILDTTSEKMKILNQENIELNMKLSSLNSLDIGNNSSKNSFALFQNSPNPFSKTTNISYRLNSKTLNAFIIIYNINGVEIKKYTLDPAFNDGKIIIEANSFQPGVYLYSLVADNKLIDTKKMIITSE